MATGVMVGAKAMGGPCYKLAKGGAKVEGLPRCIAALPGPSEVGTPERPAPSFERDACRVWFTLEEAVPVSHGGDRGDSRGLQPGGVWGGGPR